MKPAPFSYHCPATLAEALDLLSTLDDVRPLAGGQSLVPMLNLRLATPSHLVDLRKIPELHGITEIAGGLRIGAMTTQRELEHSSIIKSQCPLITAALEHVGHQQTRNRGTIGGSLCHLDPSAELPVVASALDARMNIAGRNGSRQLPFADFPIDYLTTALVPGELLTSIEVPAFDDHVVCAFEEFARRPADFAVVAVAVVVRHAGHVIEEARIAVGGLGSAPQRIRSGEEMLAGQVGDTATLDAVSREVASRPSDGDLDNPAEYRRHLAGVLTRRALVKAFDKVKQSS